MTFHTSFLLVWLFLFSCLTHTSFGIGYDTTIFASGDASNDRYGYSMALDASNGNLVVGVATKYNHPGEAHLFTFDDLADVWSAAERLTPSDGVTGGRFGYAVAIEMDYVVVTAPYSDFYGSQGSAYNNGAAYIYKVALGTEIQKIVNPGNSGYGFGDQMGRSVAMTGKTIAFGADLDSLADGSSVYQNFGSVLIYEEVTVEEWALSQIIKASNTVNGDHFGTCVKISDSNRIMVGADGAGSVYFFAPTGVMNEWEEHQRLTPSSPDPDDSFGSSMAFDGTILVVGADTLPRFSLSTYGDGPGFVCVFSESSPDVWEQQSMLSPSDGVTGDFFGFSVYMHNDTVFIGAPVEEAVYIFNLTTSDLIEKVTHPYTAAFGTAVVVYKRFMLVADYQDLTNTGKVYHVEVDLEDHCATVPNICTTENARCVDGYLTPSCIPCKNNGTVNPDSGKECDCYPWAHGYGNNCQNYCHNGYATADEAGCDCTGSGATGNNCDTDIDDCASDPCANGGLCEDLGTILFPNHNNEFNCSGCGGAWSGETCNECTCLNNGTCNDPLNPAFNVSIPCSCTPRYVGEHCESVFDACASSPCNAGTCTDLGDANAEFHCNCTDTGYEGAMCEIDLDDCLSSPCFNNAICKNKNGFDFKCTCASGYTGLTCNVDIDDCSSSPCDNGGICSDAGADAFTCNCTHTGYEDVLCNTMVDHCLSSPCEPYQECTSELLTYSCAYPQDPCMYDVCASVEGTVCVSLNTNPVTFECVTQSSSSSSSSNGLGAVNTDGDDDNDSEKETKQQKKDDSTTLIVALCVSLGVMCMIAFIIAWKFNQNSRKTIVSATGETFQMPA